MSNFKKILQSFQLKNSLNPKVWENPTDPKKAKLFPKVRKALEKISEEFIDDLGDEIFVDDVHLMGSLANFNWSQFSDFDLHIMVDFDRYGKDKELYKELFELKKKLFNLKHDIKIFDYDVEVYAQDSSERAHSDGVYSIMDNEWINVPTKTDYKINDSLLKKKIKCWTEKIDDSIEDAEKSGNVEDLKTIKEKLKDYRKSGLEKEGELSYENLVFKFLRRSGHIEKLFDIKNKLKDRELSVERIVKENAGTNVNDVISNSRFLSDLMKLIDNNLSFELTPGQKQPKDTDVEKIQTALQYLGFPLPQNGIDGKFGEETQDAVKKFQQKYQLSPTGRIDIEDIKHLIAALIIKNFDDSDLGSLSKSTTTKKLSGKLNSPNSFKEAVSIISNELEGGYYHPIMKEKNPSKYGVMGKSGETMFGMDRKHGEQENYSAGREFWKIVDSFNPKDNWEYGYMLNDKPEVRSQLEDLIVEIMKPQFESLIAKYLSDESRELVLNDPKLFFNFVYATYNGSGWFQGFAKKFNTKVAEGERDIEALRDYALQIRKEASHSLIRRSGNKIERIFDAMP